MWYLKFDTEELIYNTERDSQNHRLVIAKGKEAGEEKDWESGVSRFKLLFTGWMDKSVQCVAQGNICKTLQNPK